MGRKYWMSVKFRLVTIHLGYGALLKWCIFENYPYACAWKFCKMPQLKRPRVAIALRTLWHWKISLVEKYRCSKTIYIKTLNGSQSNTLGHIGTKSTDPVRLYPTVTLSWPITDCRVTTVGLPCTWGCCPMPGQELPTVIRHNLIGLFTDTVRKRLSHSHKNHLFACSR